MTDEMITQFLDLACLGYSTDNAERHAEASAMLAAHPALATASIWTAATVGDAAAVARFLDTDASLLEATGRPRDWEPLMYACYSRVQSPNPTHSTLEAARVLLTRGANADAHFLWGGTYPFTALTGAFGEGEGGPRAQPRHPQWRELAELLLAHGARADENQGLYNRMFTEDDEHLELLLAHGLGPDDMPRDSCTGGTPPTTILGYQLCTAASSGYARRVRLLLDHGAHMDERAYGHTPWEQAMRSGHLAIAQALADAGARTTELTAAERLTSHCLAGDGDTARRLIAADPPLLGQLANDILGRAVGLHNRAATELLLDLGVDVGACDSNTALHQAAWHNDRDLVDLLLARGADPTIADKAHNATPANWANHAGHRELGTYLTDIERAYRADHSTSK